MNGPIQPFPIRLPEPTVRTRVWALGYDSPHSGADGLPSRLVAHRLSHPLNGLLGS
jgi:hypothetical protein